MRLARVSPGTPPARWQVLVPGSKSITNRALLLAGVAQGTSTIVNPLLADDTLVMRSALSAFGAEVDPPTPDHDTPDHDTPDHDTPHHETPDHDTPDHDTPDHDTPDHDTPHHDTPDHDTPHHDKPDLQESGKSTWISSLTVGGLGGAPTGPAELWCGMAGTVGRFLVPMLATGSGRFDVDAHEQLRRRPFAPVLDALRAQGATIEGESLPLRVAASGLEGGEVPVDTSISSQFLSGLLMAAPLARNPTRLIFEKLVSRPYLDLTVDTMRAFGIEPEVARREIRIPCGRYRATRFEVEPDASTASYFLASAAITGTTVILPGLDLDATRQGDIELIGFLEQMGCELVRRSPLTLTGPRQLRGVEVDMSGSSDVFMTLACVAPFADGPTTIEGVGHTRVKESDRIGATAENLRRLGIRVQEHADALTIWPGEPQSARLPTYDDHRIAMAFALIGARVAVALEAPEVVAKTCPTFWELWRQTGATIDLGEEGEAA